MLFSFTFEHRDINFNCDVWADYTEGSNGSYWEPPEPPELMIERVELHEMDCVDYHKTIDKNEALFSMFNEVIRNHIENDSDVMAQATTAAGEQAYDDYQDWRSDRE